MASSGLPWFKRIPIIGESAIALASVAVAVVAALQLERLLGMSPQASVLLCAVMFVAWAGGTRAAIIATALAVVAFHYFFLEPTHAFSLELKVVPRLLFFSLAALFLVLLIAMALTALYGWTVERIAYRPLRHSYRLAPLISAIGMSEIGRAHV